MLFTILEWVFFVLLGIGMLVFAVFGSAWYVAKEINAGHGQGCPCPACQRKRQRQWKAREQRHQAEGVIPKVNPGRPPGPWRKDLKPLPDHSVWVSTFELRAGMTVIGKESKVIYRVDSITATPSGWLVVLINAMSQRRSVIPVQSANGQNKIWLIRRPRAGGGQ